MKFEMKHTSLESAQKKTQKGFTLIELLISMTITLVIVGLLMGMTKMAVGAWQKTHAKVRSSRLAQEVFDSVGKDLEGIVIRPGNDYEWLLIKESENTATENGPGSSKEMVNPLEVSFFSAVTDRYNGQVNVKDEDKGGDISMVRFRLIHQDVIEAYGSEKPVFALYRERIDPDVAFNDLLAKPSLDGLKEGANIVNRENFLAENIFDFTLNFNFEYTLEKNVSGRKVQTKGYKRVVIRASDVKNKSLSILGKARKGDAPIVERDAITVGGESLLELIKTEVSPDTVVSSPRLAGADVSILVLSDRGMNALKNKPIDDKAKFAKFLKQNGHHYSKSVILPQP